MISWLHRLRHRPHDDDDERTVTLVHDLREQAQIAKAQEHILRKTAHDDEQLGRLEAILGLIRSDDIAPLPRIRDERKGSGA
jgi:hypothetical protein